MTDASPVVSARTTQESFPAPVLALRVGVTGNRWHDPKTPDILRLNPDHRASIENTIRVVLEQIHDAVNQVTGFRHRRKILRQAHNSNHQHRVAAGRSGDRLVASRRAFV